MTSSVKSGAPFKPSVGLSGEDETIEQRAEAAVARKTTVADLLREADSKILSAREELDRLRLSEAYGYKWSGATVAALYKRLSEASLSLTLAFHAWDQRGGRTPEIES